MCVSNSRDSNFCDYVSRPTVSRIVRSSVLDKSHSATQIDRVGQARVYPLSIQLPASRAYADMSVRIAMSKSHIVSKPIIRRGVQNWSSPLGPVLSHPQYIIVGIHEYQINPPTHISFLKRLILTIFKGKRSTTRILHAHLPLVCTLRMRFRRSLRTSSLHALRT